MNDKRISSDSRLTWIEAALTELQTGNRYRTLRVRESPHVGGLVQLDGEALVDFGSNDYLGIAADPRMIEAVRQSVGEHGWGSGASPLVSGHGILHSRLERELAEFEGVDACALFPTGFAANMAAITCVCGKGDLILSDRLNHASIIDGCQLSRATVRVYDHCSPGHVDQLLHDRKDFQRALIVTDSLFSMDGDRAPLVELSQLARKHNCMVMVDEAHATGVWGENGRGIAEEMDVESTMDIRVGTLSKAFGSIGGFVSGSRQLIDWIRNRGRSYIFSTSIPGPAAAASLAALEIIRAEPQRRLQLRGHVALLRSLLNSPTGNGEGNSTQTASSQIFPMIVGDEQAALKGYRKMHDLGLFVPAIRPPTVPANACRLRVSLSSSHTPEQITRLATALNSMANNF